MGWFLLALKRWPIRLFSYHSVCLLRIGELLCVLAVLSSSLSFATDERHASVTVLTSSPLLGKLVKEVGGELVQPYSAWQVTAPPQSFEADEATVAHAKKARLFFAYGVPPFANMENAVAHLLPEDARVVMLEVDLADGAQKNPPESTGEMALDPLWAFSAAAVIGAELTKALPDQEWEITSKVREFRAKILRLTYGDKYATEAEVQDLLAPDAAAHFREWAAGLSVTAETDGLVGKLVGYTGVNVTDDWGLLGAFCARFELKYSMVLHDEGSANAPQQLQVLWTPKVFDPAKEDRRIVRLSAPASSLLADAGSVSEAIAKLMAAMEPCVVTCKVRELLSSRGTVEPTAALALDNRAFAELSDTLSRANQSKCWSNVVWILGYLGDAQSVQLLLDFATRRFTDTSISPSVESAILLVPKAMGLAAAQGNNDGFSFLESGCSSEFWKDRLWQDGRLGREGALIALTENSILGIGISGRKNADWVREAFQNRDPALAASWATFLSADLYLWWNEKYGSNQFLQEWRTPVAAMRMDEHWESARAKELKAVFMSHGIKLPDILPQ